MQNAEDIKQRMAQQFLKNSTRRLVQAKARNRLQPSDFRWQAVALAGVGDWEKALFAAAFIKKDQNQYAAALAGIALKMVDAGLLQQAMELICPFARKRLPETAALALWQTFAALAQKHLSHNQLTEATEATTNAEHFAALAHWSCHHCASSLCTLAQMFYQLKEHGKARYWFEKAITLVWAALKQEQSEGFINPDTLRTLAHIPVLIAQIGEFEYARQVARSKLSGRTQKEALEKIHRAVIQREYLKNSQG